MRTGQRWTEEEDEYVKENYPNEDIEIMTQHLGRTYKALRDRARTVGVTRGPNRKTHEQFLKEFYSIFDKEEYIIIGEYVRTHKHIKYFHTKCQKYNESTPASLLQGHGCICLKENSGRVSKEEFLNRVQSLGEGDYEVLDTILYKNTTSRVEMLHKECGNSYKVIPNTFFNGRRCPYCFNKGNSKGERIVEKVLKDLELDYIEQATFPGMTNIKQLYYDFLLDKEDIIIEYQGLQHYKPVEHFGGFERFKSQVKRDNIKKRFAEENGYVLIEVPHTLDNHDKVYKFLKEKLLA